MPGTSTHLQALEAESIHIIREAVAESERPVLLFSGGKDSAVVPRLAVKAFWPARLLFPLIQVDTGHNFPEVIEFGDRTIDALEADLGFSKGDRTEDIGLRFIEVSVDTPLEVCEQRDPKGLYARAEETTRMTAMDHPYEAPLDPGVRVDGAKSTSDPAADAVLSGLS